MSGGGRRRGRGRERGWMDGEVGQGPHTLENGGQRSLFCTRPHTRPRPTPTHPPTPNAAAHPDARAARARRPAGGEWRRREMRDESERRFGGGNALLFPLSRTPFHLSTTRPRPVRCRGWRALRPGEDMRGGERERGGDRGERGRRALLSPSPSLNLLPLSILSIQRALPLSSPPPSLSLSLFRTLPAAVGPPPCSHLPPPLPSSPSASATASTCTAWRRART